MLYATRISGNRSKTVAYLLCERFCTYHDTILFWAPWYHASGDREIDPASKVILTSQRRTMG